MTKNGAYGIAAVAALAAILYFGHPQKEAPIPLPQPAVTIPAPPAKPVSTATTKPAPAPVPLPTPAPAITVKPKPTQKGKPSADRTVYHRVEQGGARGPEISCNSVKPFAEGKSPAELAALAKLYGVSVAEVQRWFVCG